MAGASEDPQPEAWDRACCSEEGAAGVLSHADTLYA